MSAEMAEAQKGILEGARFASVHGFPLQHITIVFD